MTLCAHHTLHQVNVDSMTMDVLHKVGEKQESMKLVFLTKCQFACAFFFFHVKKQIPRPNQGDIFAVAGLLMDQFTHPIEANDDVDLLRKSTQKTFEVLRVVGERSERISLIVPPIARMG